MEDSSFLKLKDPDGAIALQYLYDNEPRSVGSLLSVLLRLMDKTNGIVIKHCDLAKLCSLSIKTIKLGINRLVELNFIQKRRLSNGCVYFINSTIATRCSKHVELLASGDELWGVKLFVSKDDK